MNRTWSHHGGDFLRAHFNQHAHCIATAKAQRINCALQATTVLRSALDLTSIRACETIPKTIVNVAITIKVV